MFHNKHSTKAANKAKKLQNLDRKIDRDAYSSSFKVLNVTSNTYNSR